MLRIISCLLLSILVAGCSATRSYTTQSGFPVEVYLFKDNALQSDRNCVEIEYIVLSPGGFIVERCIPSAE